MLSLSNCSGLTIYKYAYDCFKSLHICTFTCSISVNRSYLGATKDKELVSGKPETVLFIFSYLTGQQKWGSVNWANLQEEDWAVE